MPDKKDNCTASSTIKGIYLIPADISEKQIEEALKKLVKRYGGKCVKVRCPDSGFFDRHVYLPGGRIYLLELKRPKGGRLSELQKITHRDYRALGFQVCTIWNFAHLNAFEDLIKRNS